MYREVTHISSVASFRSSAHCDYITIANHSNTALLALLLFCRALFRPTQWAAEVNAAVAAFGFHWLVGESELVTQAVEVSPGVTREQRSVVHIKKCRYLEDSGCVGLCTNMCKVTLI